MIVVAYGSSIPRQRHGLCDTMAGVENQNIEEVYGWNEERQENYLRRSFNPREINVIQVDGKEVGIYVHETETHYVMRVQNQTDAGDGKTRA